MSKDLFDLRNWLGDVTKNPGAAERSTGHKAAPTTKNSPAHNVNGTLIEELGVSTGLRAAQGCRSYLTCSCNLSM